MPGVDLYITYESVSSVFTLRMNPCQVSVHYVWIRAKCLFITYESVPSVCSLRMNLCRVSLHYVWIFAKCLFITYESPSLLCLGLERGLDVDKFAPRLSFFWGIGMNFYMVYFYIVNRKPETHCIVFSSKTTSKESYFNFSKFKFIMYEYTSTK